jgi:hypothetical protein
VIWTNKHNQAIEKTFEDLEGMLKDCDSRLECQDALKKEGWPYGQYSEIGNVSEVVQKVMGNRAILKRCRELMTQ